jgi:hypothetical protein
MPDTRVVLAMRSVAFYEAYRPGRVDHDLPDYWHASIHGDVRPQYEAPQPRPSHLQLAKAVAPQGGIPIDHFGSDSYDDEKEHHPSSLVVCVSAHNHDTDDHTCGARAAFRTKLTLAS